MAKKFPPPPRKLPKVPALNRSLTPRDRRTPGKPTWESEGGRRPSGSGRGGQRKRGR